MTRLQTAVFTAALVLSACADEEKAAAPEPELGVVRQALDKCLGVVCAPPGECEQAGVCNPGNGKCTYQPRTNGISCDDNNPCTVVDACQSGTCRGTAVTCAAQDQCHVAGVCNPATGACTNPVAANGTACTDGNACTQADTCQAGSCVGASPVVCTAQDGCHDVGSCNPSTGTCSNPASADGRSCTDGDACTVADSCQSGACVAGGPVVCTAQDQCHGVGTCNPTTGVCSNPVSPNGSSCSDGNACTVGDACQAGSCQSNLTVVCAAQDQCHDVGTCDPATGACSNPPVANGTACSDNDGCTLGDSCQGGACVTASVVTCTALNQCHDVGSCDPATGMCSTPAKSDGTSCSDGNACTLSDTCLLGQCEAGAPVTCTALDQCHEVGVCDPATGVCPNPVRPNGGACDDSNPCTISDACESGDCGGTQVEYAATRSMGFYMTHPTALSSCLAQGTIHAVAVDVSSADDALGLLWASPIRFGEAGAYRSAYDRSRMLLARQFVVATCNARLFNSNATQIMQDAFGALSAVDCYRNAVLTQKLDEFNSSGGLNALPAGFDPGVPVATQARVVAKDPTAQTSGQCAQ